MDRPTPLHRQPRWWLLALAWWTLDALRGIGQYQLVTRGSPDAAPLSRVVVNWVASAWLWVPITVLILALCERFPLDRDRWRGSLRVHLAAMAVVIVGRAAVVVGLNPWIEWYLTLPPVRYVLLDSVANNLLPFWMLVGVGHMVVFAARSRERGRQLAEARLHALKAQLHPHFLFNALNTVSSLVRRDPDGAERTVARLSELLRHTLGDTRQEVSLDEELEYLRAYLAIEQTRFEDRLRVRWEIDPAALEARVPHLLLQPLVENAIRHGVSARVAPSTVTVAALAEDGALRLRVRDDGPGLRSAPGGRRGVGLANTAARLEQLYGERHSLRIGPAAGGGTEVHITLPFRRGPAAEPLHP